MQNIAIQIGNEFLDLQPGTTMELQEENPFLQLEDTILGPYSLPITVSHSERNIRLLNLSSAIFSNKLESIPCIVWENGVQHSIGLLKIERIHGDLNDLRSGSTSVFYLTGSSSFYQSIQDKKLRALEFGGVRTFEGLSGIFYEQSSGFGRELADACKSTINEFDYALFPVLNDAWQSDIFPLAYARVQNNIDMNGNISVFNQDANAHNPICPFPYLVYVLKKIFTNFGWELKGNILDTPSLKRCTLLSFKDIPYCSSRSSEVAYDILHPGLRLYNTVSFDLKNYMPDVTVGAFLLAIKNRFGWYYDFDNSKKQCTIRLLKDVVAGAAEDITNIVRSAYDNKVDLKGKIYSMINNFDPQDNATGAVEFAGHEFLGSFASFIPFPANEVNEGKYVFLSRDNSFYICRTQAEDETVFEWQKYADNIYDYKPDGANTEIITAATACANERIEIQTQYSVEASLYHGIFPRCDQNGSWYGKNEAEASWGIHLAFFHGFLPDENGKDYPYASSHPLDNAGARLEDFSLSFEFNDVTRDEQIGLYKLYWEKFLSSLKQNETLTVDANYKFTEKNNINFGDPKVINYTKYFIKNKTSKVPYSGSLQLELIKV